jgi:hypothetical protein
MYEEESVARAEKPAISAKDILEDIRAGCSDSELMRKYNLSARGLHRVFKKLVRAKVVTDTEISERADHGEDTVIVDGLRKAVRVYPALAVVVHDAERPSDRGILRDVSERGLGTRGLQARVGEKRMLVVNSDEFDECEPVVLDAVCRWAKLEDPEGLPVAGFQITDISEEALVELRKLINLLTFSFDE